MSQSILVIEDEVPLRQALNLKLGMEGYKVIQAQNGEEGLIMARAQKPDLILLDILMPRLNGLDVIKGIRETAFLKDIPIIVLTNLPEESTRIKVKELGGSEYLVKSNIPIGDIVNKIKSYLDK